MEKNITSILFSKVRKVRAPHRGTTFSAGLDFFIPDDMVFPNGKHYCFLKGGQSIVVPSGIRMNIPKGYALIAQDRSSVAVQGLILGAKLVDQDYQGEIHFHLINSTRKRKIRIFAGQKITQFALVPVIFPKPLQVKDSNLFKERTTRGKGAFGSTDKHLNNDTGTRKRLDKNLPHSKVVKSFRR